MIVRVEPLTSTRALKGPFDYLLPEGFGDVEVGSLLVVPFGRRELLGVVVEIARRSDVAEGRLLTPVRALGIALPGDLVELGGWIAAEYCSTVPRALRLLLPPGLTRGQLSGRSRGLKSRRPAHVRLGAGRDRAEPPPLTVEQREAVEDLLGAIAGPGDPQPRLLQGVTGSGKTEVYLRLAAAALARDRGVIVLVPEIALAPQITSRFLERFGETVAVMHSRLRPVERREEWRRMRAGEARVCIGPRSAIFAPVGQLGLIVIDEEHESSYKHEGDPRYDAREVALRRARRAGALLVAGSATPRPESVHRMSRLRLASRVDGRPLPAVEILDMRGQRSGLHPASHDALAALRERGGKAIVLLNRRGWSNFLSCRACGSVWSCPNCDVALVMHRAQRRLACHHCDHREPIPARCECGSSTLARHGAGTERLQDELRAVLDDGSFPVFRLDADTASAGAAQLLSRFERAPAGVLLGTQMVAKGHDFPDVTLGLVLDADATLRFPDFRAEERTFALVAQLAGRVGRGAEGRVLVQTIAPEARSILRAAAHDSDGFLEGELSRRRALAYPPFRHLIRVVCSSAEGPPALQAALELRQMLASALESQRAAEAGGGPDGAVILGPASLFRLRGKERQALVVKASDRAAAVRALAVAVQALARDRRHRQVSFAVDVDPQ